MTSDPGRYWDFTLSLADAEKLCTLLEQQLAVSADDTAGPLDRTQEALNDACWLGRWLGEDPRVELTQEGLDCLLAALRNSGGASPLVAVCSQLEKVRQSAPKCHEAIAV